MDIKYRDVHDFLTRIKLEKYYKNITISGYVNTKALLEIMELEPKEVKEIGIEQEDFDLLCKELLLNSKKSAEIDKVMEIINDAMKPEKESKKYKKSKKSEGKKKAKREKKKAKKSQKAAEPEKFADIDEVIMNLEDFAKEKIIITESEKSVLKENIVQEVIEPEKSVLKENIVQEVIESEKSVLKENIVQEVKKPVKVLSLEEEIMLELEAERGAVVDETEELKAKYPKLWTACSACNLEKYFKNLINNGYKTPKALSRMDVADLKKIGVPREEYRQVFHNILDGGLKLVTNYNSPQLIVKSLYEDAYVILVGIDNYGNPGINKLHGCVNDIERMRAVFTNKGYHVFEPLIGDQATKKGIEKMIDTAHNVIKSRSKKKNDSLLIFYFSGHGYKMKNCDDAILCAYDFSKGRETESGFRATNLANNLGAYAKHLLMILDCCFAGEGVRGDYVPKRSDSILVNSIHPGAWLLGSASKGEQAKEETINGRMRGLFSYYLEYILSDDSEGIFSEMHQNYLKSASGDTYRKHNSVVYPLEIVEALRRRLLNKNQGEHVCFAAAIYESLEGIPIIGKTIKDFIIVANHEALYAAEKIAAAEISERTQTKSKYIDEKERFHILWKIMAEIAEHIRKSTLNDQLCELEDIMQRTKHRILIYGKSGVGKTKACMRAMSKYYQQDPERIFMFYLDLSDCTDDDIFEYAIRSYFKNKTTALSCEEIEELLIINRNSIVWLIDNYQYLCEPNLCHQKKRLKDQINNKNIMPNARIFARPVSLEMPKDIDYEFTIGDFSPDVAKSVIKKYYSFPDISIAALYARAAKNKLELKNSINITELERIMESTQVSNFMHNPQQLELFLKTLKYEDVIQTLIIKNVQKRYLRKMVTKILKQLAWLNRAVDEAELFEIIRLSSDFKAAESLYEATLQTGFLARHDFGFVFTYTSVREYFMDI